MRKVLLIAGILIMLVAGFLYFIAENSIKKCKEEALETAVLAYPASQYPDKAQREELQNKYEKNLITSRCQ